MAAPDGAPQRELSKEEALGAFKAALLRASAACPSTLARALRTQPCTDAHQRADRCAEPHPRPAAEGGVHGAAVLAASRGCAAVLLSAQDIPANTRNALACAPQRTFRRGAWTSATARTATARWTCPTPRPAAARGHGTASLRDTRRNRWTSMWRCLRWRSWACRKRGRVRALRRVCVCVCARARA